jgi:hypothetical protein
VPPSGSAASTEWESGQHRLLRRYPRLRSQRDPAAPGERIAAQEAVLTTLPFRGCRGAAWWHAPRLLSSRPKCRAFRRPIDSTATSASTSAEAEHGPLVRRRGQAGRRHLPGLPAGEGERARAAGTLAPHYLEWDGRQQALILERYCLFRHHRNSAHPSCSLTAPIQQKYGGASAATVPLFMAEAAEWLDQTYNTPSILQYETFNEGA